MPRQKKKAGSSRSPRRGNTAPAAASGAGSFRDRLGISGKGKGKGTGAERAPRYEVIPSRQMRNPKTGATASLHGAHPGPGYVLEERGFTIRDNDTGAFGLGRKPFDDRASAQALADDLNARRSSPGEHGQFRAHDPDVGRATARLVRDMPVTRGGLGPEYDHARPTTDRRIAYLRSLGEDKRNTPAWRDAMHERGLLARARRIAANEDVPREPPVRTRRSQRERAGKFEDAGIALMYGAVKTAQGWAPQVWENGRELMSTYAVGHRDRGEAEQLALQRAEEQRERFSGDWHITIEPSVATEPVGLARRRRSEHAAPEPSGLDRIYNVSLIETWRDDCGPDEEYTRERLALYVRACRSLVRGVPSNEPTPAGAEAWAQFERRAAAQERAGQLRSDMLAAADTFEQLARKLK